MSNETLYGAADSFDLINIGPGVGDRSGEPWVPADFVIF